MSTNINRIGANVSGYSHVFVAPNEAFTQPSMTIKVYDEFGVQTGTELVDIPTYYQTVDTALGRYVRTIKPLAGGTHTASAFNTDENKGEFTSAKANIEASGMIFGGNDYTLEGNVAWLIPYSEFEDKFMKQSPLVVGIPEEVILP